MGARSWTRRKFSLNNFHGSCCIRENSEIYVPRNLSAIRYTIHLWVVFITGKTLIGAKNCHEITKPEKPKMIFIPSSFFRQATSILGEPLTMVFTILQWAVHDPCTQQIWFDTGHDFPQWVCNCNSMLNKYWPLTTDNLKCNYSRLLNQELWSVGGKNELWTSHRKTDGSRAVKLISSYIHAVFFSGHLGQNSPWIWNFLPKDRYR